MDVLALCSAGETAKPVSASSITRQWAAAGIRDVVAWRLQTGITAAPFQIQMRPFQLGARAAYALQTIREKLLDHKTYIVENGDDLPEIRNWQWGGATPKWSTRADTAADNV